MAALVSNNEVMTYMGLTKDKMKKSGIKIYNYASLANIATVKVLSGTMTLLYNATSHAYSLTNTSYDTLAELEAVIDALAESWFVEVLAPSDTPSADLVKTAETNCKGKSNNTSIQVYDNYRLTSIVAQVSKMVENFCDVTFTSTTYSERYDGNGGNILILNNRPVTKVTKLSIDKLGMFTVKNTSTDASDAFARIESTGLILTVVGGANASTSTLLFASYATMTTLVAAVNALGKGWEADIENSEYNTYPTSDLIVDNSNLFCLDQTAQFAIPNTEESDYELYPEKGWIYFDGGFTEGERNVYVNYVAGHATMPDDLKFGVLEIIAYMYNKSKRDPTLASERLGDYSWSAGGGTDLSTEASGLRDMIFSRLAPYIKFSVVA